MHIDKQPSSESGSSHPSETTAVWPEIDSDETGGLAEPRRRFRLIIGRAVLVYLLLFLALGVSMSLLGVDPLAHNGLMPKALLLFVGLALLMALINTAAQLSQERSVGWLLRGLIKPSQDKRKEASGNEDPRES